MKSFSPDATLREAMAALGSAVRKLETSRTVSSETATLLWSLEETADLGDAAALAEITRLQTIANLSPHRVAFEERAVADKAGALLEACHSFIGEHLGPFCRRIMAQTQKRVRQSLRPHFPDSAELENAMQRSASVLEVHRCEPTIRSPQFVRMVDDKEVITPELVIQYAEELLTAFDRLTKLDKPEPAAAAS
jgi:hypothetical protein